MALQAELDARAAGRGEQPASPPAARDFVHGLPRELPDAAAVTAHVQRACSAAGVVLVGVSITAHSASNVALARTDLDLELKGSYAGIKQVLAETLGRHASATLKTLRLRADGTPGAVQATLVLSLWAQPLMLDATAMAASAGLR